MEYKFIIQGAQQGGLIHNQNCYKDIKGLLQLEAILLYLYN